MEPTTNADKKLWQEADELRERYQENDSESQTANILVAGITGSGKSTLLNAVFGQHLAATGTGQSVTDHIQEYSEEDIPIRIWDTVGLEINSEKTQRSIDSIKKKIAEKASSKDPFDRIHAIWYCINSRGSRYQSAEANFIHDLHALNVPFIIVLTQCIAQDDEIDDFISIIKQVNAEQGMGDIPVVPVIAKEFHLRGMPPIPAFGLENLVEITTAKMPDFIRDGFVAAQQVDKRQKRLSCEKVIYEYVEQAKNGFWERVPIINILTADKSIQSMVHKIAKLYNTYLDTDEITKLMADTSINAENAFKGLVLPDLRYTKNVADYLEKMKSRGFEADIDVIALRKTSRVAVMVTLYGYVFMDSVEAYWDDKTGKDASELQSKVQSLIERINERLKQIKIVRSNQQ